MQELKIGTSWVRGVVGDALTPELTVNFACAFGTFCDGGPVVIGRDTRRSSEMLRSAVVAGLLSCGCEVVDLGLTTTPLVSFAVRRLAASGGVSITGSHNSARWNALKFIGPEGALLNAVSSEELLDIYHASAYLRAAWHGLKRVSEPGGMLEAYIEACLGAVDAGAIRRRAFRVAADFTNGPTVVPGVRLLEALGCRVFALNDDASGEFAHAPAPTPTNMRQLSALMRCVDADLGAAVNVDGDRLGLVTSSGTALSEECGLPLVAAQALARGAGTVITNLSTSRMVDSVAERHGARVLRAPVGEGFVADLALMEGAVVAGEGNGGVAILPASHTFDALLALAMLLESAAANDKPLHVLADGLPALVMRKGEVAAAPDQVFDVIERVRERFDGGTVDLTDGVRIEWPDAWLHVRASNTEPIVRVIAEAEAEGRADILFGDAMTCARRALSGRRPAPR